MHRSLPILQESGGGSTSAVPRASRSLPIVSDGECGSGACASNNSPFTVIVKPTHACNIACTYCFISDAEARSRMPLETVDVLFERTIAHCGHDRPISF